MPQSIDGIVLDVATRTAGPGLPRPATVLTVERILEIHASPEAAERAVRRAYQAMMPDERVALTVDLMRRYYSADDAPGRLQRVLAVLERS